MSIYIVVDIYNKSCDTESNIYLVTRNLEEALEVQLSENNGVNRLEIYKLPDDEPIE